MRWDALAAGAFVATLTHQHPAAELRRYVPVAWAALVAGLGFMFACFVAQKGLWPRSVFVSTAGLSLIAAAFAATVFLLMTARNKTATHVLGASLLLFFGQYSYGLYVIHSLIAPSLAKVLPLSGWMAHFESFPLAGIFLYTCAKIAACVPLTLLSWHLYEKNFLKLKRSFSYRRRRFHVQPLVGLEDEADNRDPAVRHVR